MSTHRHAKTKSHVARWIQTLWHFLINFICPMPPKRHFPLNAAMVETFHGWKCSQLTDVCHRPDAAGCMISVMKNAPRIAETGNLVCVNLLGTDTAKLCKIGPTVSDEQIATPWKMVGPIIWDCFEIDSNCDKIGHSDPAASKEQREAQETTESLCHLHPFASILKDTKKSVTKESLKKQACFQHWELAD